MYDKLSAGHVGQERRSTGDMQYTIHHLVIHTLRPIPHCPASACVPCRHVWWLDMLTYQCAGMHQSRSSRQSPPRRISHSSGQHGLALRSPMQPYCRQRLGSQHLHLLGSALLLHGTPSFPAGRCACATSSTPCSQRALAGLRRHACMSNPS